MHEQGNAIMKKLYSADLPDGIRVRALTGLCKIAVLNTNKKAGEGGFSEGSLVNLAKKLRPCVI